MELLPFLYALLAAITGISAGGPAALGEDRVAEAPLAAVQGVLAEDGAHAAPVVSTTWLRHLPAPNLHAAAELVGAAAAAIAIAPPCPLLERPAQRRE